MRELSYLPPLSLIYGIVFVIGGTGALIAALILSLFLLIALRYWIIDSITGGIVKDEIADSDEIVWRFYLNKGEQMDIFNFYKSNGSLK